MGSTCCAFAWVTLTLLAGCSASAPRRTERIDLDGLLPGVSDPQSTRARDAIGEILLLEIEGRPRLADLMVRRFPAAMFATLARRHGSKQDLRLLATAWERTFGPFSREAVGWSEVVRERAEDPARHEPYDAARREVVARLAVGDVETALDQMPLPVSTASEGASPLHLEAGALHAFLLRLGHQYAPAAREYANARRGADPADAFAHARLSLLEYEALVRLGSFAEASLWRAAVEIAARAEFVDPVFWSRARDLAPASEPWPPAALEYAGRYVGELADRATTDALLQGLIAQQWLDQGDANRALLAFTQAESGLRRCPLESRLRVGRAKSLLALGRPRDAAAAVVDFALAEDPGIARPALAILGAIELELRRPARAQALLHRAVESEVEWNGRTEAIANLAIANLLLDETQTSREQLAMVRHRFALEGNLEAVGRCLRNELRAAITANDQAAALELRAQLEALGR
ncbi:MAG: hypothetical protein AB7O52_09500 [Planctomycetota bacterium]